MLRILEGEGHLEIQDRMPLPKRVFLLLISLIPRLAPYELVIRPEWQDFLTPFFLIAAIISIGALAVSALFIWAAVASCHSLLRIDRLIGTFSSITEAPLISLFKHEYPIASIEAVDVETYDWSDGSPSYSLRIETMDGKSFKIGSLWSRGEIERVKERLRLFLDQ